MFLLSVDGGRSGRRYTDAVSELDSRFAGSIPEIYERYLVPLIFEPYAARIASRVATAEPSRLLEIATGTGVVARRLVSVLPRGATIVATDINKPMLAQAAAACSDPSIEWRHADAMALPFDDGTFDTVVCQFGVMFFPDKPKAFAEARRVLKPGGWLFFSVWDRIEENEFPHVVDQALERLYPEDPPRFMTRVPHGYHDLALIGRDLTAAGFQQPPEVTTIAERSRAASPAIPAIAFCQGTPIRNWIEGRSEANLVEATAAAERAIAERFGSGAVDGKIQAHIIRVPASARPAPAPPPSPA
jgi:SAM-dependent methyltransferase